jgi:hypothetical protein
VADEEWPSALFEQLEDSKPAVETTRKQGHTVGFGRFSNGFERTNFTLERRRTAAAPKQKAPGVPAQKAQCFFEQRSERGPSVGLDDGKVHLNLTAPSIGRIVAKDESIGCSDGHRDRHEIHRCSARRERKPRELSAKIVADVSGALDMRTRPIEKDRNLAGLSR